MSEIYLGTQESFGFENDPIVIRHYEYGVQGGKVLDLDGFEGEFIRCGHVIIRDPEKNIYKPMPVANGEYAALPQGYEYVGVCVATKSVKEPFVGIMTKGEVNDVASPYSVKDIKAAFVAAVPGIRFDHD